jgi:hypothetical protein
MIKMPSVNVTFTEAAKNFVARNDRGIVGLIFKDGDADTVIEASRPEDIPTTTPTYIKAQMELAMIGYMTAPQKVIAYVVSSASEDLSAAFSHFEMTKISFLAAPGAATQADKEDVVQFVKSIWSSGKGAIIAVLPNMAADSEVVVNWATDAAIAGDTVYSAADYCSRIAGMLATVPTRASVTYAPLPDLTACTKLTEAEQDAALTAGKLIAFWDGEKVKIARGMNSLQTTNYAKGSQFKKIRIVSAMGRVRVDIRRLGEDYYIGKYENSYDNKCVLVTAISDYMEVLKSEGVLSRYEVGIDIEANRKWLAENGIDPSQYTDDEIKAVETGERVFLTGKVKFLDAIEDIDFPITV